MEAKIVDLFLAGLLGGLVSGLLLNYVLYQPQIQDLSNTTSALRDQIDSLLWSLNSTGAGINNQVQVEGTVNLTQTGTITFSNSEEQKRNTSQPLIETTGLIVNHQYSVVLVGGHTYSVAISDDPRDYLRVHVPLTIYVFTANW